MLQRRIIRRALRIRIEIVPDHWRSLLSPGLKPRPSSFPKVPCYLPLALTALALLAPPRPAQEDCFRGDVHTESQTVSGFLARFAKSSSPEEGPTCRVELFSLQGGMVFHAEDTAMKLVHPSGLDLNGDGSPDAVFEGYSGGQHCCWTYWVVSLGTKPRLLAALKNQSPITLTAGQQGNTDIQTLDGAFDYFDCLSHAESPVPTVFLRLQGRTFKDVGAEHWEVYDKQIRDARSDLSPARTSQFRAAKGAAEVCSGDARTAMPEVLSIVLAHLYAGQEQQAWKALDEMWPPSDRQRMRALILQKRKEGILRFTRPASPTRSLAKRRNRRTP
jgi:hypothetical protein